MTQELIGDVGMKDPATHLLTSERITVYCCWGGTPGPV